MMLAGTLCIVALVVIWLGYPALVHLLAVARKAPIAGSGGRTSVTLILATRASPAAVRDRVDDLLGTTYPSDLLQLVVALDGTDAEQTRRLLHGCHVPVTLVPADAPGGKAAALNAAARSATGDVLVFADVAQRFDPHAVAELVAALGDPRIGAVSGRLELPESDRVDSLAARYWRFERRLRAREARVHSCIGVTGAIYAMRRTLWRDLPPGLILDDLFGPMRLVMDGWRVGYAERARAFDTRHFEPGDEFRRKVRTLTGVVQVCAWLPGILDPARNPVWIQFVFHKVLRLLTPYLVAAAVIGSASGGIQWVMELGMGATAAAGFVAGAVLALAVPRMRRALAHQLRWNIALQGSAAVATYYGLRGRWDVWR